MVQLDWQETEADLYRLYRNERHPVRKIRLQALWHLRQGKTEREVSYITGTPERTLRRWVRWYRQGGLSHLRDHLPGGDHGEKGFLTQEKQAVLIEQAKQEGFSTAQEASQWIAEHLEVHYAPRSVFGVLKRLGLKKKVPRPRSDKTSLERQEAWKKGGWVKH